MTNPTNIQQPTPTTCHKCGSPNAPHSFTRVDEDHGYKPLYNFSLCDRCCISLYAADAGMRFDEYLAAVPGWLDDDKHNGMIEQPLYDELLAYYAAIPA